jgi:streptomycin 6-kinase
LPERLAELALDWQLSLGRSLPGGSASYVTGVTRADGTPAVLKVAVDDEGFAEQAATLERAAGHGYATLLRVDRSRRALLLERLGPALGVSRRPPEEQLDVLVDTLREAWLPPLQTPTDKALGLRLLIERVAPQVDGRWPAAVFERALAHADSLREPDPADLVVVHGDPHPGNALRTQDGRYRFVDPDGFVADRAYDLGVTLRDWCSRIQADGRAVLERYCDRVAERSGVDRDRIWRWAYLERVSTGLYVLDFGAERVGRPFLDSAALLL